MLTGVWLEHSELSSSIRSWLHLALSCWWMRDWKTVRSSLSIQLYIAMSWWRLCDLNAVSYHHDKIRFINVIRSSISHRHRVDTAHYRIGQTFTNMGRRLFSVCGQVVLTVLAMAAADCPGCSSFVLTPDERAMSSSPEVRSPIPVIAPPPGWVLGSEHSNAPVVMEVFLDLVCPDSARAWTMLHELRQAYTNEDLKIVVHIYQLPYHINAYTISQVRKTIPIIE